MPKYTFANGQVFTDDSAYSPLVRKSKTTTDTFVLLIVQPTFFNRQITQENDSHEQ